MMKENPESSRTVNRRKFIIWSGLGVLYLAGVLTGVIGTKLVIQNYIEKFVNGGPGEVAQGITDFLSQRANFSEAQREQVLQEIKKAQVDIGEIRKPVVIPIARRVGEACEGIYRLLEDHQKKNFKYSCEELQKKIEQRSAEVSSPNYLEQSLAPPTS